LEAAVNGESESWEAELEALHKGRAEQGAANRYRVERRIAARGRHRVGRTHPDNEQPTDEQLGVVLSRLRARCGECGKRAVGEFVRRENGVVWEASGDRVWLADIWSSNYTCRDHGLLAYRRDDLDDDLDAAQQRPDKTKVLRLPPGSARPPSRRASDR
jgi:hypothetical protein